VAPMDLRGAGFGRADVGSLFAQMEERVRRLPGIASASVGGALPFRSSYAILFSVPGHESLPHVEDGGPYVNAVSRDFFSTTGTHILRGRGFNLTDDATHARSMVISESMARLIWKGDDPLGQCVVFDADSLPCTTVVGVAQNTHRLHIVEKNEVLQYYVRLEHAPAFMEDRILFVRPKTGDPAAWTEPVRRVMQTTAPNLPFADVRPMRTLLGGEIHPWRLGAAMFGVFGALALVLTALGLYSVIAYSVAQRMHEMGVRIALGARRTNILSLIVRQGVGVALTGTAIGAVVTLAAGRLVQPLLYQVSPHDPVILLFAIGVLLVVATVASLVPAHRATSVDPARALRAE